MVITDLATHPWHYVTIAELAKYWAVRHNQIRKRVLSGELEALRLGPRVCRIRTSAALDFERRARTAGPEPAPTDRNPRQTGISGPHGLRLTVAPKTRRWATRMVDVEP